MSNAEVSQLDGATLQADLCSQLNRLLSYLERHIPADLRRQVDPQDIAQDTLFEAFRSADRVTLDGPDATWRWMVTIARNRLINVIHASRTARRGGRLKHLYDAELQHSSVVAMLQELAVSRKTPSKSAARREFLVILDRSIDRLQPTCRDAIRFRFVDGMSLKQVADRLRRSEDAIQRLCAKGLRALRLELRTVSLYF